MYTDLPLSNDSYRFINILPKHASVNWQKHYVTTSTSHAKFIAKMNEIAKNGFKNHF